MSISLCDWMSATDLFFADDFIVTAVILNDKGSPWNIDFKCINVNDDLA